ncbi:hypothetical protein GCM10009840_26490 [Pseudolysinimonas kribbensis]|uniref:Uncharacterized protein n=1 Tax=Pseudolysinimonas kribbensis TaxID=433641 RepID=A0ABQ6K7U5_9MICO|nr:hypothetical protein [Pseudolysinimonas kribbensis]GMA96548.1 hypothetical protein GCM10025881_33720 [Pseudolysinimonas kribbensis]
MFVALLVALGVTALVAVAMMLVALQRSARLTIARGLVSLGLCLGVVAVVATGVLALSSQPAQAAAPVSTVVDLQLPTR